MIYQIGWKHIGDCCKLVYEQAVRCLHGLVESAVAFLVYSKEYN